MCLLLLYHFNEQFILSLEIAEHFLKDLLSKSEDVTFIRYPVDRKITNSSINDEIDELRHSATSVLISRDDVIVAVSVSYIYSIGEVEEYKKKMLTINVGDIIERDIILLKSSN